MAEKSNYFFSFDINNKVRMSVLCPVDANHIYMNSRCDGVSMNSFKYSCQSSQCKSTKPREVTVITRLGFKNGYETMSEQNMPERVREVFNAYQQRGIVRTWREFLQHREYFYICRRHSAVIPFQFAMELKSKPGPSMYPPHRLVPRTYATNDPQITATTRPALPELPGLPEPTTKLAEATQDRDNAALLLALVGKLKALEESIYYNSQDQLLMNLQKETSSDVAVAIDKLKDFLQGNHSDDVFQDN